MGLCLIAYAVFIPLLAVSLPNFFGIFMAAAGLGFVIFVHELGHFAVARMCGVKCEKFMIGFDFGGLKLSKKWGETEYGIGVFPLGGYVKMFGQDDDPGKTAEQIEASTVDADSEFAIERKNPDGTTRWVDRRSYQSKAVWQRMLIISAGVVMNMIFAFVFAFFAFGLGVDYVPCVVSQTTPGAPAWRQSLQAGDEIVRIGDRLEPSCEHLKRDVALGDMEAGVSMGLRRFGQTEAEDIILRPEKSGGMAIIGMSPGRDVRLHKQLAVFAGTPAAKASTPFKPGDVITAINGKPVASSRELTAELVERAGDPIEVSFERRLVDQPVGSTEPAVELLTSTVEPRPAKRLGLVMTMGPIAATQQGSPAEAAGLSVGDKIVAVDGEPVGNAPNGEPSLDPATLANRLAASQEPVRLLVVRSGAASDSEPEEVEVMPRSVTWYEIPGPNGPMPLPALGLAYEVQPTIESVITGSPAAEAGIQAGDTIVAATITSKDPATGKLDTGDEIELSDENKNWPALSAQLRRLSDGSSVELKIKRGEDTVIKKIEPAAIDNTFVVERGFTFMPILRQREVTSTGEQLGLAADHTWFSLTTVVRFLQKLASRQVDASNLGGPITILGSAYLVASESVPSFLLFLTMLSANLAVLNFLPIPVLDGGHMIFLAYEGITGKPANEKLTVALHVVGMVLLLSLMIYVTKNDVVNWFL
ncbi:MAG: site-2 protease family protein [Planctomycetota bacterium]